MLQKSLLKKQQQWIEHEQLRNRRERFKNKSCLALALHQWPSLGERAWPLRKSTAHKRKGEQWTNPRRVLQTNALSISAFLLAQPTIPAAQFRESQRYVAWCAPGLCVPITSKVGVENDPYGSVNIELLTKGQHILTMANGVPPHYVILHLWSPTAFPSGKEWSQWTSTVSFWRIWQRLVYLCPFLCCYC